MLISHNQLYQNKCSKKNFYYNIQGKKREPQTSLEHIKSNKQSFFYPLISFYGQQKVGDLSITNLQRLPQNSLRGESLSSPKNRVFLPKIKKLGIENVIDLRKQYASDVFPELCKKNGLNYYSIPVDSFSITDEEIISNLPRLFELIDKGNFYIACAQGLHRTDIALSLNYVFNPHSINPPILYGHEREYGLKVDDISRRLHSIKKKLTPEDIRKFGFSDSDNFESVFRNRKAKLYDFNKAYLNSK